MRPLVSFAIIVAIDLTLCEAMPPEPLLQCNVLDMFPDCCIYFPRSVGDGHCDGGEQNTKECGWDGGDCLEFNDIYPGCRARHVASVGDGVCDGDDRNTAECDWDGGDCKPANELLWEIFPECTSGVNPSQIGNGHCDGDAYNTVGCGWDGGDCIEFNKLYPDCIVQYPEGVGNGRCDGGAYNTAECGWDGGDCEEFNQMYPDCAAMFPYHVGDGVCHEGLEMMHYGPDQSYTEECGWDGGDCIPPYDYAGAHGVKSPSAALIFLIVTHAAMRLQLF